MMSTETVRAMMKPGSKSISRIIPRGFSGRAARGGGMSLSLIGAGEKEDTTW